MIKVYLIDDHRMFLDGITSFLREDGSISVIGQSNNAQIALQDAILQNADIILCDIEMPDGISGFDFLKLLPDDQKRKVVFFSMNKGPRFVLQAFKEGASGFLVKDQGGQDLIESIKKAANGKRVISPDLSLQLLDFVSNKQEESPKIALSKREHQVLKLICEEKNTNEIAKELMISASTVSTHKKNLISKFDVKSSIGLVNKAHELNLLDD